MAEFETQHTCSCGEVYRAERATLRAFGPGRVLALRIMRNKDRREVLRVPLTLRLEAREFRLRAGVCHSGSSYQCGHYTCFAPLSDGKQWVLYDDGAVQVCSVPKELCLASRVLFYELAELATEPTGQMEASRLEVAKTEEELVAPALPEDAAPAMRASGEQNVHVEEVPGALVADGEGDAANWKSAVADESVVAAASLTQALEEVAEGMETTCGLCDEELKCLEHMRVGRGQDALEHDAERLLRVFERTGDPSACHALLQELPAFLSQDGAQTVHAAANAWHAELSDLSEDCVNGVTAMYWLGTSIMLNHILQHCWPHALRGTVPETFPVVVSDEAFCSAVAFVHRRFAYGHAVLSVSVQEAAWLSTTAPPHKEKEDLMPTVLKLLRSNPGSCITFNHVLQAELGLKRMWERGSVEEQQLVQQHVQRVWLVFKDIGVGTLCGSGQQTYLHKIARAALPTATVAWLRRQRVPLFVFGPCRQQREVDLVALQVPGLLVQVQRHPVAEPFQSEPRSHAVGAGGVASKADLLAVPVKKEALTRGQQGAQTRARRNADRPELVSVTDLGNNILSSSQLVAHLHGRPEWQDCKHKVRVVWQNQQRVASKVQCAEGAACPFVWHCTYFLTSLGHAAGTLLITSTGKHDHAKPEVGSGRPAKLWTPSQLGDACHYMTSTKKGHRSARQLQNHSRKRRDPSSKQVTAAGQEVAPTQIALEDWPRCGKALEDLYLLGP